MKKLILVAVGILVSALVRADTEIPFPNDPNTPPLVTSLPFIVEVGGTYSDGSDWSVGQCLVVGTATRDGKTVKKVNSQVCGGGGGGGTPTVSPTPTLSATPTPTPSETFVVPFPTPTSVAFTNQANNFSGDQDFTSGNMSWNVSSTAVTVQNNSIGAFCQYLKSTDTWYCGGGAVNQANDVVCVGCIDFSDLAFPTPTPVRSATPVPTVTNAVISHAANNFTGVNTFNTDTLFEGDVWFDISGPAQGVKWDRTTKRFYADTGNGANVEASNVVCSGCVDVSDLNASVVRGTAPWCIDSGSVDLPNYPMFNRLWNDGQDRIVEAICIRANAVGALTNIRQDGGLGSAPVPTPAFPTPAVNATPDYTQTDAGCVTGLSQDWPRYASIAMSFTGTSGVKQQCVIVRYKHKP